MIASLGCGDGPHSLPVIISSPYDSVKSGASHARGRTHAWARESRIGSQPSGLALVGGKREDAPPFGGAVSDQPLGYMAAWYWRSA